MINQSLSKESINELEKLIEENPQEWIKKQGNICDIGVQSHFEETGDHYLIINFKIKIET